MSAPNGPLRGLRVLVVEDEYLVAREIRHVLSRAGCAEVRLAASLDAAGTMAGADDLQAVLLDIKLGEQDVYPLAERLERLERQGMPVIFVTGYATEAVPAHLEHLPLVQKPFQHKRLVAALQQVVSAPRPS